MKKQPKAANATTTNPLVQRVSGKITARQYVQRLDERVSDRRKETASHRRTRAAGS